MLDCRSTHSSYHLAHPGLSWPCGLCVSAHFLPSCPRPRRRHRCSGRCRCRHYPAMFAILHSLPRPQAGNLALPPPACGMRHEACGTRASLPARGQRNAVFRIGEGVKLKGERARVFPKQIGNNFIK